MPLGPIGFLCLMLPAAALSGGVDAPTSSDTDRVRLLLADAQPFSGVATPTSAIFLLAIPKRAVWEWNLPDTPDDVAEYLWEVVVNCDGKEYRFGFSLWRMPGDSYQAGDLEGLLRFGQSDLWLTRPFGGVSEQLCKGWFSAVSWPLTQMVGGAFRLRRPQVNRISFAKKPR